MFSRISLSTFSRVITKSRAVTQSFPQKRSLHASHHIKNINSRITYVGCCSPQSTVFNTSFIRFASTTEATKVPLQDALPQIPDVPTPIKPEITEIVGEASLESFGLGGYLPVGIVQNYLYWVHTTCGLPWWATIVVGTASLKIVTFPLFLRMQKHQALTQVYHKELSYFERKKKEGLNDGDQMKVQMYSSKQENFFASHNMMTMKKTLIHYSIQGCVFMTFFMALNGMARAPVKSMEEGGMGWFSDLTVPDPYYALPLLSSLSTAIIVHLNPPQTMGLKLEGFVKYLKFAVPAISFPIMIFFKSTVLLYIITSTWLTFLSQALIRIPKFRAFCNIPPIVKLDPKDVASQTKGASTMTFLETVKETWKTVKQNRATNAAYSLDQRKFESAGRGPLVKTYKFDPTKVMTPDRRVER